jgi:hypothetical protein
MADTTKIAQLVEAARRIMNHDAGDDEPQTHEFVCMFMTERRRRAREGPCGVALCGQPADAPIPQTGGK